VVLPVHANQGRCRVLVFIRALHVFLQPLLSNVGLGAGAPAVGAPATAGSGSAAATEAPAEKKKEEKEESDEDMVWTPLCASIYTCKVLHVLSWTGLWSLWLMENRVLHLRCLATPL